MNKKFISNEFRRIFFNPFTVILIFITITFFIINILNNTSENIAAFSYEILLRIIIISAALYFIAEHKRRKEYSYIKNDIDTYIRVRKNNSIMIVNPSELSIGDIVVISAGERVPADIELISSNNLFVSQAAINGESNVIEKFPFESNSSDSLDFSDIYRNDMVFAESLVISGTGEGIVKSIGKSTVYEKTNTRVKTNVKKSIFKDGSYSIMFVLIKFSLVIFPLVFILAVINSKEIIHATLFAISTVIGLVPELLPMVMAVSILKGSTILYKKRAVLKSIESMRTMSDMDILCIDKTGTLTNENLIPEYYMDILGNESKTTLEYAYINSFFSSVAKNPIDESILSSVKAGFGEDYCNVIKEKYCKYAESPFEYKNKISGVTISDKDNKRKKIIKGDIDSIIEMCSYFIYNNRIYPFSEDALKNVKLITEELFEDGMKVIGVAEKNEKLETEKDYILVGYIAFFDAPKKEAFAAIEKIKKLGVSIKVLSGDKKEVTSSICKRLNIDSNKIITGNEISKIKDDELKIIVDKYNIYAELSPYDKTRIVDILKEKNTVGFLGDGINDVGAISNADVGISVDTATDAAKDAAEVIVIGKKLSVVADSISESRNVFINILDYIRIAASSNFGNIISIRFARAFLPFMPMSAVQILFMNLIYDTMCMLFPLSKSRQKKVSSKVKWGGEKLAVFMRFFGPISSIFDIITFAIMFFVICPYVCGVESFNNISDLYMQNKFISVFQTGWFIESIRSQIIVLNILKTDENIINNIKESISTWVIGFAVIIISVLITTNPLFISIGFQKLPFIYYIYIIPVIIIYSVFISFRKRKYIIKYGFQEV